MPTPPRRPDDADELARQLRARARNPPRPALDRRRRLLALGLAALIVLAFFGLVFLAAILATIADPTFGGWTP